MSFESLGLPNFLLRTVNGLYDKPTPIQSLAIPVIMNGGDVTAKARTGTGKTAAFVLPILSRFDAQRVEPRHSGVVVLTLVPTRELALQVAASYKAMAAQAPRKVKVACVIGGEDIQQQITALASGANFVVATPGRLVDLYEQGAVQLDHVEVLVLDEADKMLDMGFQDDLNRLLGAVPKKRQTLLFSATLPKKVLELSERFLNEPQHLEAHESTAPEEVISQRVIEVNRDNRRPLLQHLLRSENWAQTLVFVASKRSAENLAFKLKRDGFSALPLHGGLDQAERIWILNRFKQRKVAVLVATDLASRGLDIEQLSCVVNYDLPRSPRDYLHRIGRTGRAGETGMAISFIDHETRAHFTVIEKRSGISLKPEQVEGFALTGEAPPKMKGGPPVKGKRKSKKDKLREQGLQKKVLD